MATIAGVASDTNVFGPRTYIGNGRPVLDRTKFRVEDASGSVTLRVTNRGVRTGFVALNGRLLLRPSDFRFGFQTTSGGQRDGRDNDRRNQNGQAERDDDRWEPEWDKLRRERPGDRDDDGPAATLVERAVTLRAGNNEIVVFFLGRRGTSLTIEIVRKEAGGTDTTPPTITASASPAPNVNNWNNTPVTVTFACADVGSGIATCPEPVVVSVEGAAQVVSGRAVDRAGNMATTSVTLSVDRTLPVIAANQSPSANEIGWNSSPVVVTFAATDALSGLAPGSLSAPVTLSADGANLSASGHATDLAGNIGTITVAGIDIDRMPPALSVALSPGPNSNGYYNGPLTAQFTCSDVGSGIASCPPDQVISTEGANQSITGSVTDRAGNAASVTSVAFGIDLTAPIITVSLSPPPDANGSNGGPVTAHFMCSDVGSGVDVCPPDEVVSTEGPNQTVTGIAIDRAGNTASVVSAAFSIDLGTIFAPPLNHTAATPLWRSTEFLYSGPNPIQEGVVPGTIAASRAAVLRGRVLDRTGPLSGVAISISGHPEFGRTMTRVDGMFDMAVNGGGQLTVEYQRTDYLPAQRLLTVPWQDFAWLPDVVLVQLDPVVTTISFSASPEAQVARGTLVQDEDGSRQATLIFPEGSTGTLVSIELPDGTLLPALSTLNIRATEYTVGANGLAAMPAPLPAASAYTYAVELSADEAMRAGATKVTFDRAIAFYLENFLDFPVGTAVPAGYFDRGKAAWIASDDGRIVRILSAAEGIASVDVAGTGVPASSASLAAIGITDGERRQLATLYAAGQSLWRVPITHFTPVDLNWPSRRQNEDPPNLTKLTDLPDNRPPLDNPCVSAGSVIECQNQILGESAPIRGTSLTLNYRSDRVAGRALNNTLTIPLTGPTVPSPLQRVYLEVLVAGQRLMQSFPPTPNQTYTFEWDQRDGYGRTVQGPQPVHVRIGYAYRLTYAQPPYANRNFGMPGGEPFPDPRSRAAFVLWQEHEATVGTWEARHQGLGAWTLDRHHVYDPIARILYQGTGQRRSATAIGLGLSTVPGSEGLGNPSAFVVGADGSVYIAVGANFGVVIQRISATGLISTVAGGGSVGGGAGDGGAATAVRLEGASDLALGPDESLYIVYGNRVRRVLPDGTITTVAGGGSSTEDGIPARSAMLLGQHSLAIGPDGTVYISELWDSRSRIRAVSPDSIISTVAGTGTSGFSGDGGPATAALIYPVCLSIGPDGSLYFCQWNGSRIRRIAPDGIITTVAGNGEAGFSGDGGPATSAQLGRSLNAVVVDSRGTLFISDDRNGRIRQVATDGTIATIVGNGLELTGSAVTDGALQDGVPALNTPLGGGIQELAVGPDGTLYMGLNLDFGRILRTSIPLPGFSTGDNLIASESGTEVYVFSPGGKHLRTILALTGVDTDQFSYGPNGLLAEHRDGDGNVTRIERDAEDNPTAIVAPFSQRTPVSVDANGYLASLSTPAGTTAFTYTADGLLIQMATPNGFSYRFAYEADGRLSRDEDPSGGSQSLHRANGATEYTVTKTSGLGAVTAYQVDRTPTGDQRHVNTLPDGTRSTELISATGTTATELPDGTRIVTARVPDMRFGMQAPITSTVVSTPGGLSLITTTERVVALANPANPLSLVSLTDTTTVNGRQYVSIFASATRTITSRTPAGRQTRRTLDAQGRLTLVQVTGLDPVAFTYDATGRLTSTSQGARMFSFAYDGLGNLASTTDPLSRTMSFERDAAGRVTTQTLPGGRGVGYSYDSNGNMVSITPPGGAAHEFEFSPVDLLGAYNPPSSGSPSRTDYSYNVDRQLERIARPDGQAVTYSYNTGGRLSTLTFPRGTYSYSYDPGTGSLTSISAPGGVTLDYLKDGALVTETKWSGPVPGRVGRAYDNQFRIASESVNGANTTAFTYDLDGLLTGAGSLSISRSAQTGLITSTSLGNTAEAFSYSSLGEVASYQATASGTPVFSAGYTRDNLGRIVQKVESVAGVATTYSYSYDPAGRLAEVRSNGALLSRYTYDLNGNRLSYSGPRGAATGSYDAQDRVITYDGEAFAYSANGEVLTRTNVATGEATFYTYDALGNLTTVILPSGSRIDYVIDGQNRRIGKRVNGTLVQAFLYQDQLRPVAELDGAANVVSRFVYGVKANVPEYMIRAGTTYRVVTDQLGSPRLVVNTSSGVIAQQLDYDEFGDTILDTNPGFQPFGFAGGLYDSSAGLVRFGARDYDAKAGRWTAKDPIRFVGRETNLYAYASSDPVNFSDPRGEFTIGPVGISIIVGTVITIVYSYINKSDPTPGLGGNLVNLPMLPTAGGACEVLLDRNNAIDSVRGGRVLKEGYLRGPTNSNFRKTYEEIFPDEQPARPPATPAPWGQPQ